MGFFDRLKKINIFTKIKSFFYGKTLDENYRKSLEEILIQSDVSISFTKEVLDELEKNLKGKVENDLIYQTLKDILHSYLREEKLDTTNKTVLLVVGINGAGKTTTIGKLANLLKNNNKIVIGAADTFRAAATEQLEIWSERANVEIVKGKENADPSSVVYDTLKKEYDIAIIDTSGRLQNKDNLMRELKKLDNTILKFNIPNYKKLMILDATLGQNSIVQAESFSDLINVDGFILTKLDSTSKGGVVFEISKRLNKPIYFIGLGESIDDLKEFSAKDLIDNMF